MQTFDPTQYKLDYPQFDGLSNNILTNVYNYEAMAYCNWLDDYFADVNQQYYWSCIVLSHILTLKYGADGQGATNAVGRVSDAKEGSVSVTLEYKAPTTNSEAWWNQTSFGAEVLALWANHGVFFYVPCA
jgi:hypothetical protein